MLTRCYEVPLDFLLHHSFEYGTLHFTRKMADSAVKMAAIHHRLLGFSDVNASMPISILSDRSDDLSYIAIHPPICGVSAVPCVAYTDVRGGHVADTWRTLPWRTDGVQEWRTMWRTAMAYNGGGQKRASFGRNYLLAYRSLRDLLWRTDGGQSLIGCGFAGLTTRRARYRI